MKINSNYTTTLVTKAQLAEHLCVCAETITHLKEKGVIRHVKDGHKIRYDLNVCIERYKQEPSHLRDLYEKAYVDMQKKSNKKLRDTQIVTVTQLAKHLNRSTSAIGYYTRYGIIPHLLKDGTKMRYDLVECTEKYFEFHPSLKDPNAQEKSSRYWFLLH